MRVDPFQARFDDALYQILLDVPGTLGLAVSGGADSMALLQCVAASPHARPSRFHVFTVDHGLRTESAAEAEAVQEAARALGMAHKTLIWRAPNPSQSRARQARHRLIAQAMREAGAQLLLTGHTLSDNIESFLIRARAGSGWYGLAGMGAMTASPVWPEGHGIFTGRPMLGFERAEIREWLTAKGVSWCEDPSNENKKYERVRMRRLLESAPHLPARIERIQSQLQRLRRARDEALAVHLEQAEIVDEQLKLPFDDSLSEEALAQLLAFTAMIVAGTDQPARTARSRHAADRLLQTAAANRKLTLTLGGAIIRKSGDILTFERETNRPKAKESVGARSRLRHICAGLTGAGPAYV